MTRLFVVALVATSLAACAGGAASVRPVQEDPSNPQAAEARPAPASLALIGNAPVLTSPEPAESPAPASGHEHHQHHHGAPAAPASGGHEHAPQGAVVSHPADATPSPAVYTCPMHPEVREEQPGRCPMCKMKLVPRHDPAGGDAP